MTKFVNVELYFDGACRGNPGTGGWGVLCKIFDPNSSNIQTITASGPLGELTTSNVAEYYGLINGLRQVLQIIPTTNFSLDQVRLKIFGDSQLVINQVNGGYSVLNYDLQFFHAIVVGLLQKFCNCSCGYISRNENQEANALARAAASDSSPSLTSKQYVLFRPNLGSVGKARFGNTTICASNDILSVGSSGVYLIDAKFLVKLCGLNILSDLIDPHPIKICTSVQRYNILGVLNKGLKVRIWDSYNDTKSYEVIAKNVFVVHKLPVPFHFTDHAPETRSIDWIFQIRGDQKKFNADAFDQPYCFHPYWDLDKMFLTEDHVRQT